MADPHSQDPATLERLVEHTLRDLPARAAPRSLVARVHSELARRAALPWWRRSFSYWPALVRGAFVLICASLIALSVLGGARWMAAGQVAHAAQASIARLPGAGPLSALWNVLNDLASALAGAVPSLWLDASGVLLAVAYVLLLAIAAATWRVVQPQR